MATKKTTSAGKAKKTSSKSPKKPSGKSPKKPSGKGSKKPPASKGGVKKGGSKQAGSTAAPPSAGGASAPGQLAGKVRIRMYQVGFGDCFLVSVPSGSDYRHIKDGTVDRMTNVVAQIATETQGKLALVIATHAHQDHISGFASEMAKFETFEVGEVWMPWLEDPKDPVASKLQVKRMALANALQKGFAAGRPSSLVESLVVNATGKTSNAAAAAGGSNAQALDLLQSGFRGKATVRYLKAGDTFKDAAGITGLNVQILSPSTDESFLGKMDPPSGEHYLRLGAGDDGADAGAGVHPFADKWIQSAGAGDEFSFTPAQQKEIDDAIAVAPEALAFALDKVLNNTSVVGLFTFGKQSMLFPGDAQWGNWISWLDSESALLNNLTYYKVGHHCSVNATPKRAVQAMTGGSVVAMASTQSSPFPSIPDKNLVAALDQQTGSQYIQSDWLSKKQGALPSKFVSGDFWIDYLG